jgi:alpha 1,2-mannosyltransferase
MINTVIALCLISGALVILHAYSPIVFFPKLSLLPKGATVPAKYYNNVGPIDDGEHLPGVVQRANATFLMLSRNDDVDRAVITIKELENRFNLKYGYPWVFLNEQPFSEDFKRRVSLVASGPVHFGKIPRNHWYQPNWINETRAQEERHKMEEEEVIYGDSVPYRNMCRFNSGFFYRQPLLLDFRYYWRVEPGVRFHCDIHSDPFLFMQENNKIYGFTISTYEFPRTIETLWSTVGDFVAEHPDFVSPNSAMRFLSDDEGKSYNLCHFWSNFEIGDLDFWRGSVYTAFFNYLDSHGGFYYERWGDAPVHSIGAALFGGTDKIHFFNEIGYEHPPFTHCPMEEDMWRLGRCTCDPANSADYSPPSCLTKWSRISG